MITPIKPGSDSRKNWRTINEIAAGLDGLGFQNSDRRGAIAGLRQRPRDPLQALFPYRGSTWLKWSLSSGRIVTTGGIVIPTAVDTEFTLTSGVAAYWFYIDFASTPEVKTSATALTWSTELVPVAIVDTATYSAQTFAVPHRVDLFNPCVSA